jgi:inositol 3-alpha-galactosyltransferase
VEYERMVYLDADIQVFDNIDELFDLPKGHFYAVMDCFCEKTWSHTPQYQIGYCQQCPDRVAWPAAEMGPPPALYFNAGMFVHEPSMATAKALLDTLRVSPTTPFAEQVTIIIDQVDDDPVRAGIDLAISSDVESAHCSCSLDLQDFLNMFFREQYKPIPLVYNLVLAMLWRHPENVQLEKVKAVHYCAAVRCSPYYHPMMVNFSFDFSS